MGDDLMIRARLIPVPALAALAMLAPAALAAAFQAAAPIPGWGDPAKGSQIKAEGKALTITLPADAPRNFTAEPPASQNQNAPTVLRDVEGNFSVQVKAGGDAESAGLIVWQDERNFVILARTKAPSSGKFALAFDYWKDGQKQGPPAAAINAKLDGDATYLRLTRRMDKLRAETSADGQTWTDAGTLNIRLPSRMRLGVLATGQGGTARFEDLQQKAIPLYPTS
jgi:regulation of enolase protein 1 (concanavalin A-like superfamily)